jgi:hypothetical protein
MQLEGKYSKRPKQSASSASTQKCAPLPLFKQTCSDLLHLSQLLCRLADMVNGLSASRVLFAFSTRLKKCGKPLPTLIRFKRICRAAYYSCCTFSYEKELFCASRVTRFLSAIRIVLKNSRLRPHRQNESPAKQSHSRSRGTRASIRSLFVCTKYHRVQYTIGR